MNAPREFMNLIGEPADLATDVAVIGAGPAGLAAAEAAATAGVRVALLDAAPVAGGNVWRARAATPDTEVAPRLRRLAGLGVVVMPGTRVVWPQPDGTLLLERDGSPATLRAKRIVLATGARERLLPFPGWTRRGVFGAGGLQALAKGGWPVQGRRVLVAGTGPLLLAAAATLRRAGAHVIEVAFEAETATLAGFAMRLAAFPARALDALTLRASLAGVPVRGGWRIVEAQGVDAADPASPLAQVTLARANGRTRTLEVDDLAVSWGLVPQVELAESLGCALAWRGHERHVVVDTDQRTTRADVFAAGEQGGVAGAAAALASGAIAGRAAAHDLIADAQTDPPVDLHDRQRRDRAARFAALVAATFPPPADLAARWRDDTLVCRCEDVAWSAVRAFDTPREAKMATRCGMGHCQGRTCGEALRLAGCASPASLPARPVRAPIVPVPLSHVLALPAEAESDDAPARAH